MACLGDASGIMEIKYSGNDKEQLARFGEALLTELRSFDKSYSKYEKAFFFSSAMTQGMGNFNLEDIVEKTDKQAYEGRLKYHVRYRDLKAKEEEHEELITGVIEKVKENYPLITYKLGKAWR